MRLVPIPQNKASASVILSEGWSKAETVVETRRATAERSDLAVRRLRMPLF